MATENRGTPDPHDALDSALRAIEPTTSAERPAPVEPQPEEEANDGRSD